ncbi:MAG: DinB family protein [Hydrotalea sp.]|nr:DinB family protein [Hydrotalea sp.]
MEFNRSNLIASLEKDVQEILNTAKHLRTLPSIDIKTCPDEKSWSVAEVITHLNFYCANYLPLIDQQLKTVPPSQKNSFKSGWLGNYFTKIMKPRADLSIPSKMKSPTNAIPSKEVDASKALLDFIAYQEQLIELLNKSKEVDLQRIKIATSLSKLIKLSLGDTFRFFIAHQQRHFVQISRTLERVRK